MSMFSDVKSRSVATRKARVPVVFSSSGEVRVKQSFKDQCDINRIMGKYRKTGLVDWSAKYEGSIGIADPVDFHTAMNTVAQAEQMFSELPAEVRKRFANEPGAFLAFISDPANVGELRKLGLAKPARPEAPIVPVKVEVVAGLEAGKAASSTPPK